jgi:site-specific DNA recombinase
LLERAVYAGYVDAPKWGVSLRKGHHEPLISFATHERIQARLRGNANAPARKDINEDFPLRGFVLCDDCGEPMTSCWSKGRKKHYPYYLCDTPGLRLGTQVDPARRYRRRCGSDPAVTATGQAALCAGQGDVH